MALFCEWQLLHSKFSFFLINIFVENVGRFLLIARLLLILKGYLLNTKILPMQFPWNNILHFLFGRPVAEL